MNYAKFRNNDSKLCPWKGIEPPNRQKQLGKYKGHWLFQLDLKQNTQIIMMLGLFGLRRRKMKPLYRCDKFIYQDMLSQKYSM